MNVIIIELRINPKKKIKFRVRDIICKQTTNKCRKKLFKSNKLKNAPTDDVTRKQSKAFNGKIKIEKKGKRWWANMKRRKVEQKNRKFLMKFRVSAAYLTASRIISFAALSFSFSIFFKFVCHSFVAALLIAKKKIFFSRTLLHSECHVFICWCSSEACDGTWNLYMNRRHEIMLFAFSQKSSLDWV